MTRIVQIPLSDLLPWDGNVRKTGTQEGLEELMASIQSHGLLQPLVIKQRLTRARPRANITSSPASAA